MSPLWPCRDHHIWPRAERQTTISVSGVWATTSGAPSAQWVYVRASRRGAACHPRTQQLARTRTHLRDCPQHHHSLAKKAEPLPAVTETLVPAIAADPTTTILELDELWSVVIKQANQVWLWFAVCRKTRQIVASVWGDRSAAACQRL